MYSYFSQNLSQEISPHGSDNLVYDDLRGVEFVKVEPRAELPCPRGREGPKDRRGVETEARGLGGGVGRGRRRRRRRRLGLRRLVVHARRLRAVRVEPRRDAHAHVQHLHVPRHLRPSTSLSLTVSSPAAAGLEQEGGGSDAELPSGDVVQVRGARGRN